MTVKTAICQDYNKDLVAVYCKFWENEAGVTSLERTRAQLYNDHPDLEFIDWVVDLEDTESLKMHFLSPNVNFKLVWAETDAGYERVKVNRDLSIETV